MKKIDVNIHKASVYDEVAKTTSYIGQKTTDAEKGENSYEKIFTTDEDRYLLERYWNEACGIITNAVRENLSYVSSFAPIRGIDLDNDYHITLQVPSNYNDNNNDAINTNLFSCFTNYITGKWLDITMPDKSPDYIKSATENLAIAQSLIYSRRRPER